MELSVTHLQAETGYTDFTAIFNYFNNWKQQNTITITPAWGKYRFIAKVMLYGLIIIKMVIFADAGEQVFHKKQTSTANNC